MRILNFIKRTLHCKYCDLFSEIFVGLFFEVVFLRLGVYVVHTILKKLVSLSCIITSVETA